MPSYECKQINISADQDEKGTRSPRRRNNTIDEPAARSEQRQAFLPRLAALKVSIQVTPAKDNDECY